MNTSPHYTHLESILLLYWQCIHRSRKPSHLVYSCKGIMAPASPTTMTGARCMLSSIDKTTNGTSRRSRSHGEALR